MAKIVKDIAPIRFIAPKQHDRRTDIRIHHWQIIRHRPPLDLLDTIERLITTTPPLRPRHRADRVHEFGRFHRDCDSVINAFATVHLRVTAIKRVPVDTAAAHGARQAHRE